MVLGFREVGSFTVRHAALPWPWIALDPARRSFVHPKGARSLVARAFEEGAVVEKKTFEIPLSLPTKRATAGGVTAFDEGLHAFALAPSGNVVAATGVVDRSIVCLVGDETVTRPVAELVGDGFGGQALSFDRSGRWLLLLAEAEAGARLALLDARTLDVASTIDVPRYPAPVQWELALHPLEDAVLLLGACGQDGTFGRAARWSNGALEAIEGPLDRGMGPAGLVGFSRDGARVFLAADDQLRAHAWPSLEIVAKADFPDGFASNYAGFVDDDVLYVDGEDEEDGDDTIAALDATTLERRPPPTAIRDAMWVGRLADRALVTVTTGEPARGKVWRFRP